MFFVFFALGSISLLHFVKMYDSLNSSIFRHRFCFCFCCCYAIFFVSSILFSLIPLVDVDIILFCFFHHFVFSDSVFSWWRASLPTSLKSTDSTVFCISLVFTTFMTNVASATIPVSYITRYRISGKLHFMIAYSRIASKLHFLIPDSR